jgi:hypothetical protein
LKKYTDMDSFLKQTASTLLAVNKDNLYEFSVVLPNRRAGVFFMKELSKLVNSPTWMPRVITIEDLFYELGHQVPADKLTLVVELYQVYSQLMKNPEPLDRFYFWGEMILKDFNDIDQFRADAGKIFRRLAEIKAMEKDWSFLTPEQVELITSFWASFSHNESDHQARFLRFWDQLHHMYDRYKARLTSVGLAYSGMIYREVVDQLDSIEKPMGRYAFVGFNAFTACEEALIKYYVAEHQALLFWDLDNYYLSDTQQEAGLFFRGYLKDKFFNSTFPRPLPERLKNHKPHVSIYATPLKVNQANIVGKILEEERGMENLEDTVVILPDENLLFPLLSHLPPQVDRVNVTMGYPIRSTPVYTFLEAIMELQRFKKMEDGNLTYHHKAVVDLLGSTYMRSQNERQCEEIIVHINTVNMIYVGERYLANFGGLFAQVFKHIPSIPVLFHRLGEVMKLLNGQVTENLLETTYLSQCFKQLNRFRELLLPLGEDNLPLDFVIRLFKQVFRELKLPFEGEPLMGLQIMGVLESRNLDFKRVIICDMNEGSFPPSNSLNSLVPYALRKAFGLPVQEQNDAIYAYTFYRLLHQAEEVHLIYTTAGEQGRAGEKSRYIFQMLEELGLSEEEQREETVFVPVDLGETSPVSIKKDVAIQEIMARYLVSNAQQEKVALSPSAINTYLDCRLRFYYKYIAEVKEEDDISENVDPALFGNLAHAALEILYLGFMERKNRREVQANDIQGLKAYVFPSIEHAIRRHFHLEEEREIKLGGHLAIARDVLQKYLIRVLEIDEKTAPFELISLEKSKVYEAELEILAAGRKERVLLGGIIDRVDLHQGVIRLIDYKSGGDRKDFANVAELFDRGSKRRNKAAFQTMFYGLLYQYNFPENTYPLKPAIFDLKGMFDTKFSPYLEEKEPRQAGVKVEDYADYREEVEAGLREVLEELFDPHIPFDQTEDHAKCTWCPYKEMCGR